MKPTHVAATTLVLLAGLYAGCAIAPQALDPRVPAGVAQQAAAPVAPTASAPTPRGKADATGYWLLEADKGNAMCCDTGHLAVKQLPDGTLVGEMEAVGPGAYKAQGKNAAGALDFTLVNPGNTPLPLRFTGTISDDGQSVTLSNGDNADPKLVYKATRLF